MLCAKLATRRDGLQFPCGQCPNCRINKRREWQARLLLEAASHDYGAFVTLTFSDIGTPSVLRKAYAKSFIRSLRQTFPSLRHYTVGEYGTRTGRAHLHSHLFTDVPIPDSILRACWPFGRIHVGDTEPASLDYVLGYLLKDSKKVLWPIENKFPEFRYTSKGIGRLALPHLLIDGTEMPREFTVFGRTWPIGRYIRDRSKKMGFTVSEREVVKLERLEAQAMRSLLKNKKLAPQEVAALYDKMMVDRKEKSALLQKRAIRAAYLQLHGHSKKVTHETF